MSDWSRKRRERRGPHVELTGPVELSVTEERAIFAVLDHAIGRAGRTSVMMALRGSRAEKMKRLDMASGPGHGFFAGVAEEVVIAKVDTCFHRGWLRFERTREGLPLIVYTEAGLAKAMGYAADLWMEELRAQVEAGAGGEALRLSFLYAENQQRNQNTVLLLVEEVGRVADATWLPILRAWSAVETRRVRGRLGVVIEGLESGG
jgi:hypothetical protein